MRRHVLLGVVALLGTVQAHAQWVPGWCTVTPEEPTCSEPVTIEMGGEWPNSCIPNGSGITVDGEEIHFTAVHDYEPGTACAQAFTAWSLAEDVGPLEPGTYTVYAILYSTVYL